MKLITHILFFILILNACSPEPVLRLHSDTSEKEHVMVYQGMEYLMSEGEHSVIILAYYRHLDNRIIMDLEVFNDSDEPVRFNPSSVKYIAYRVPSYWIEEPEQYDGPMEDIAEVFAIDPEEVLLNIDKKTSRTKARNRTNIVLETLGSGLAVTADIAEGTRSSYSEKRSQQRAMRRAERRESFYRYVANLNEQRNYWETEILRITDLMPGESIAGEISFPVTSDATMIEIVVETAGDKHTFRYRQKTYEP